MTNILASMTGSQLCAMNMISQHYYDSLYMYATFVYVHTYIPCGHACKDVLECSLHMNSEPCVDRDKRILAQCTVVCNVACQCRQLL